MGGTHVPSLVCRSAHHWTAADRRASVRAAPGDQTVIEKNVVETFVDVVPSCEGGGRCTPSPRPATGYLTPPRSRRSHPRDLHRHRHLRRRTARGPEPAQLTGKVTVGWLQRQRGAVNGTFTSTSAGRGRTARRSTTTSPTTSTQRRTERSSLHALPRLTKIGRRPAEPFAGSAGRWLERPQDSERTGFDG